MAVIELARLVPFAHRPAGHDCGGWHLADYVPAVQGDGSLVPAPQKEPGGHTVAHMGEFWWSRLRAHISRLAQNG